MPAATADGPTVAMSFANNFWGKEDAGVGPLMERMHAAKQTNDELRSFYASRASLEEDYSRKLLSLSRKPLGSQEMGSLRTSLDTVRGEVESMGKQHQSIAAQMRSELEEPLAAFAGAMKERRKIVQNGIEKLHKVKSQQTQHVNKTRDRYEQDCLKIKGYLAQGHMVMGQEERKNKARLEKTQISLANSNADYEAAVKVLEETTARWNREWKAAADKFQDLEEERLDFTKSSLWTFANVASTVCVSDDASCEKVRLSLEKMEVEGDIASFIKGRGTGQEIPDPPKYINFCRGDVEDSRSETSEDESYSVAQFPRSINPAFRTSSPQPSTYESHHDPNSALARDLAHAQPATPISREPTLTPQKLTPQATQPSTSTLAQAPTSAAAAVVSAPASTIQLGIPQPKAIQAPPLQPQMQPQQIQQQQKQQYQQHIKQQRILQQQYRHHSQQPQIQYMPEAQIQHHDQPQAMPPQPPTVQPLASNAPSVTSTRGNPNYSHRPAASMSRVPTDRQRQSMNEGYGSQSSRSPIDPAQQNGEFPSIPHDPYPLDGMTMLCRTGPPSERSSQPTSARPSSRDSQSDYSNPTSFSSQEPSSGKVSPIKQEQPQPAQVEKNVLRKKKSGGFFNSPFRRKSAKDSRNTSSNRNTWHSSAGPSGSKPLRRPQLHQQQPVSQPAPQPEPSNLLSDQDRGPSPEPIDANASLALNVGQNVFPVSAQSSPNAAPKQVVDDEDPIALALAELKGVTLDKQSSVRVSADAYHGIATPAPGAQSQSQSQAQSRPVPVPGAKSGPRATPPPSYASDTQIQRLGVPKPAVTKRAMQETSQRYTQQTRDMFNSMSRGDAQSRPGSGVGTYSNAGSANRPTSGGSYNRSMSRPGTRGNNVPRAVSPAAPRSVSPRPGMNAADHRKSQRSASPNPSRGYSHHQRTSSQASMNPSRGEQYSRHASPHDMSRAASPAPLRDYGRPVSSQDMAIQLAPVPDESQGSQRGRSSGRPGTSGSARGGMSLYEGPGPVSRPRSKSVVDPSRQYTPEGRPIVHFARALYMYQAAIPEELGFNKGDVLAVLRHQDDGWWEAEIHGSSGRCGLVPSNYLQPC
ncbi:hypothetical protein MKZ38_004301 [Zalerion maritima]|uniref:Uncharacterized protein n=1 Tax=Zalerion maritima TaxID=339359 RepID=A0AAD5RM91_9PEZI|nr:hypothetical protein MKZ38_004301 [Zalerion maritima]